MMGGHHSVWLQQGQWYSKAGFCPFAARGPLCLRPSLLSPGHVKLPTMCVSSPAHRSSCLPPSVQWIHGQDLLVASWQHIEEQKKGWSCPAYVLLSGSIPVFSAGPCINLILVQRLRKRLGCFLQLAAFPGAAGVLLHELRGMVRGVFTLIWLVLLLHTCGVYHAVSPERFWYKLLKVIVYAE